MKEICHHPRQHASVRTAEPAQFLYTLISTPCGFIRQKDGVGISMSDTNSPVTAVFIDADNTLWDTDGVFADAQLALLKELEDHLGVQFPEPDRLAFVRAIDQGLAERHHEGLRYPPRFLIKALALALTGSDKTSAIRLAWSGGVEANRLTSETVQQVETRMVQDLRRTPAPRPGVLPGLSELETQGYPMLVLTEGRLERVKDNIRIHGLEQYIPRVMEAKKDQRLYERLLKVFHPSNVGFMIGDQLERDIRPAKAAGLSTIHFPGNFRPKWEIGERGVRPDHRISSFAQVPAIIDDVLRSGGWNNERSAMG
jgi:putative hydrolase of the HAD superfamily